MDIPTNEPRYLRAGVTWEWRREDLSLDFPADGGWTLTYWFKKTGATPGNFSVAAAADGKLFAVSVLAATTAAFVAGEYTWVAVATKGAETREIEQGKLTLLPRYDAAANLDDRSHNVKMLEAINACLEARASSTQREMVGYAIGSRSQQFDQGDTRNSLLDLKGRYEWLVAEDDNRNGMANGQPNRRIIGVRFGQP